MSRKRSRAEIPTPDWCVRKMVDALGPIELDKTYLELCCWHAPFACEILDRKLKMIDRSDYQAVRKVFQTIYGYELHPDNLLEGRRNILSRFIDPDPERRREITRIVQLNFPLMNGLTGLDPITGQPVYFMDWEDLRLIRYNDLVKEE